MGKRSDEADRRAVVNALSRNLGLELSRIGNRRKYFGDKGTKRRYCIVVGEEFHGLPFQVLEDVRGGYDITLVVGLKSKNYVSVFEGAVDNHSDELSCLSASNQEYKFNVRRRGSQLFIVQCPSMVLGHVCDFVYDATLHDKMKNIGDLERLLDSMTPEQQEKVLSEVKKDT